MMRACLVAEFGAESFSSCCTCWKSLLWELLPTSWGIFRVWLVLYLMGEEEEGKKAAD